MRFSSGCIDSGTSAAVGKPAPSTSTGITTPTPSRANSTSRRTWSPGWLSRCTPSAAALTQVGPIITSTAALCSIAEAIWEGKSMPGGSESWSKKTLSRPNSAHNCCHRRPVIVRESERR